MTYKVNIPGEIDLALRARAAAERKSPENVILDGLARDLGVCISCEKKPELSEAAETTAVDREFEAALRDQRLIDWEAWSDGVKRRDLSGIAGQHLITPEMKLVFAEQRRIDPELWK
jgi:hypothetical protein